LEEFGGHRQAAGLTVLREKLHFFKEALNRIAHERLKPEDLVPVIEADGEISLSDLTAAFFEEIELLAPYGHGNPRPIFFSKGIQIKSPPQLVGNNTLRLQVGDGTRVCDAIGFGRGDLLPRLQNTAKINLAYTPSLNQWQGETFAQLKIEDLQTC
jgi:single-stranded-DNA-specific exonuclease